MRSHYAERAFFVFSPLFPSLPPSLFCILFFICWIFLVGDCRHVSSFVLSILYFFVWLLWEWSWGNYLHGGKEWCGRSVAGVEASRWCRMSSQWAFKWRWRLSWRQWGREEKGRGKWSGKNWITTPHPPPPTTLLPKHRGSPCHLSSMSHLRDPLADCLPSCTLGQSLVPILWAGALMLSYLVLPEVVRSGAHASLPWKSREAVLPTRKWSGWMILAGEPARWFAPGTPPQVHRSFQKRKW